LGVPQAGCTVRIVAAADAKRRLPALLQVPDEGTLSGYDYWGDDYGTSVGDTCDEYAEAYCNEDLDVGQKSFVAQVQPFQSSEVRGLDLANDIEGFMATAGSSYVNLIGHSQGGIDLRKAARVLRERRGYTAVKVAISVSSPHRGSPVARYILWTRAPVSPASSTLWPATMVTSSTSRAMTGTRAPSSSSTTTTPPPTARRRA
jgi:hypothetical protein